jgi:uncharacterized membrane protein
VIVKRLLVVFAATMLSVACSTPPRPSDHAEEPGLPEPSAADEPAGTTVHAYEFRGRGNEPGWNLEVGPETIVFVGDYGQRRYELPTPEPVTNPENRVTTWSGTTEGLGFVLTIRGERCADTMSDETFESRVEVRIGDRVYTGCGQTLH